MESADGATGEGWDLRGPPVQLPSFTRAPRRPAPPPQTPSPTPPVATAPPAARPAERVLPSGATRYGADAHSPSPLERLADQLEVPEAVLERAQITGLESPGAPDPLIDLALRLGPSDPPAASAALGTALLSAAAHEKDDRLATFLILVAPIVANSSAALLLGPEGSGVRRDVLPNGWKVAITSFDRMRYAWREGLWKLLLIDPERDGRTVRALNELTRLNPREQETVKVAIQESWPSPPTQLAITLTGLGITVMAILADTGVWDWKASLRKRNRR